MIPSLEEDRGLLYSRYFFNALSPAWATESRIEAPHLACGPASSDDPRRVTMTLSCDTCPG